MPPREISFHRLAARELLKARNWYARRSPRAASSFVAAVQEALGKIEEGPERWPVYQRNYRWVRTIGFPYVIYFEELNQGDIFIMAVAHGRRRPGYWLRRSSRP